MNRRLTMYCLQLCNDSKYFANGAIIHILCGDNKKHNGYHHANYLACKSKIKRITKEANKVGVYVAIVKINGKIKKCPSTFFPDTLSESEVIDAILQAYKSKRKIKGEKYKYIGKCSFGFEIYLILDKKGKIITAYPKYVKTK